MMSSSLAATCEVIHELWNNDANDQYDSNYNNSSTPLSKGMTNTPIDKHVDCSFVNGSQLDDSISLSAMIE